MRIALVLFDGPTAVGPYEVLGRLPHRRRNDRRQAVSTTR